jgi:23S rRNA (cytosine1962-C5)-methyltransferase
MFDSDDYELVDFGAGRKLERFGPYLLDRASPAANGAVRKRPQLWQPATARYRAGESSSGQWTSAQPIDDPWTVTFGPLALELKLTDAGHVGVFPEQAANWRWIADEVRRAGGIKVLNLFAYTGASTRAAAAAGAEVAHGDASAPTVAWARRNACASGLGGKPVRWIVEDARKFVRREVRRGNRYDAVILDPPAYGHGPQGESWKIDDHLDELLGLCAELCGEAQRFVLFTCHSGALARAGGLADYARAQWPGLRAAGTLTGDELYLVSSVGERLHCGASVRWSRATD